MTTFKNPDENCVTANTAPHGSRVPRLWLPLVFALLLLPASVSSQEVDLSALENVINEELQRTGTPGAAIGIVRGDRLIFAKGFGVANYFNGQQTWEIIVKTGKLYFKTPDRELELTRTGPYLLSFGANLENDLVFVPNKRGKIEFLFDGLYSAKKKL